VGGGSSVFASPAVANGIVYAPNVVRLEVFDANQVTNCSGRAQDVHAGVELQRRHRRLFAFYRQRTGVHRLPTDVGGSTQLEPGDELP
jgi:hypothetical protein